MQKKTILLAVSVISLTLISSASDRKYIVGPRPPDAQNLPFSDAVLVGDTLYLSGHIGIDPKTHQAASDPAVEAKLAMDGVKRTVESAGMTMDDIVSMQVFCTDMKQYDAFNDVYKSYFRGDYPARAFIGIDKLVRGARFEVMGIAVRKTK
jgi:2-iminobutanoate/2-iminopropanoate deaminase